MGGDYSEDERIRAIASLGVAAFFKDDRESFIWLSAILGGIWRAALAGWGGRGVGWQKAPSPW